MEYKVNEKALRVTRHLVDDIKYLYTDWLLGMYSTLINHYSCPNEDSTVFAMKEVLEEHFWSGIEPDWASMEACEWWTNLDSSYFNFYNNNQRKIDTGYYYGSDLERLKNAKPDILIEWSEGKKPPKQLIML